MNPYLPIDIFITTFMRLMSKSYLTFEEIGSTQPPLAPQRAIHLYIHIPFCTQLCPYCSFHRVKFDEALCRRYFKALRNELRIYHERGFRFSGVYIGGGTPTILMDELLELIALINTLFSPADISVETNPDRLEPAVLSDLAAAGVKRVSVGVQSFDADILKSTGRLDKYGDPDTLRRKIKAAAGIVQTLNIDMIFNFPSQTEAQLRSDLEILHEIQPDQITFYPLMVSDLTLSDMTRIMGKHSLSRERSFYEIIRQKLSQDYQASSAWCFSRGASMIDEYIIQDDEYIGAGSGAFGLVNGAIYANTFSIPDYIETLEKGRLAIQAHKVFSRMELARYYFLMDLFGLKLDRERFKKRFGKDIWRMMPLECLFFTVIGALKTKGSTMSLTNSGQYTWVIMMREFFTGVDNFRDLSRKAAGSL